MWVFVVIVVVVLLWVMAVYNRLVRLRNEVKNSWSQIDVQLQRRYDLIPNLVNVAKEYMQYEKGTLEAVIQARNQAQAARAAVEKSGGPTESSLEALGAAEGALRSSLGRIFALAENYPALRASEPMQRLQEELTATENRVAFSRQAYNDVVLQYNTSQQQFPTVLLARPFGHHPADLFQVAQPEAKESVRVTF